MDEAHALNSAATAIGVPAPEAERRRNRGDISTQTSWTGMPPVTLACTNARRSAPRHLRHHKCRTGLATRRPPCCSPNSQLSSSNERRRLQRHQRADLLWRDSRADERLRWFVCSAGQRATRPALRGLEGRRPSGSGDAHPSPSGARESRERRPRCAPLAARSREEARPPCCRRKTGRAAHLPCLAGEQGSELTAPKSYRPTSSRVARLASCGSEVVLRRETCFAVPAALRSGGDEVRVVRSSEGGQCLP